MEDPLQSHACKISSIVVHVCTREYLLLHVNIYTVRIIADSICRLSTTFINGAGTKFSNKEYCHMYMYLARIHASVHKRLVYTHLIITM